MKKEEKILLHWSGEADESVSREVEALLDQDPKAREYFDELGSWAIYSKASDVPAKREGLLDEVLAENAKPIPFPIKKFIGAAAATVLVGIGLALLMKETPLENETQLADQTIEASTPVYYSAPVERMELWERLLADSGSFRTNERSAVDHEGERARLERLRM
ncbi:MAG: hypothetical protein AAF546_06545 [Verrucomicrobiota bacterium]